MPRQPLNYMRWGAKTVIYKISGRCGKGSSIRTSSSIKEGSFYNICISCLTKQNFYDKLRNEEHKWYSIGRGLSLVMNKGGKDGLYLS